MADGDHTSDHTSDHDSNQEPALQSELLPSNQLGLTTLGILRQLVSSLESSQRAVLSLDLRLTESATREQLALLPRLETLLRQWPLAALQQTTVSPSLLPVEMDTGLRVQLNAAGNQVLHLTRVQAGLLRRAQRFLMVLGNMAAGSAATYGPPLLTGQSKAQLNHRPASIG